MRKWAVLGVLACVAAGCAPMATRTAPSVSTDQFEKEVTIEGVERNDFTVDGLTGDRDVTWMLRSWRDKATNAVDHQLYVRFEYVDYSWIFVKRISDDQANALDFIKIHTEVLNCVYTGNCRYVEIFAAKLPAGYLEKRRAGFQVKFSGDGYSKVLTVDAQQIEQQLAASASPPS